MGAETEKSDMADLHDAVSEAYEEFAEADTEADTNETQEAPDTTPEPEHEGEEADTAAAPEGEEASEGEEPPEGQERDPQTGRFVPKKGEAKPPVAAKPPTGPAKPLAKPTTPALKPGTPPPAAGTPEPTQRPPQAWRAQAREKWAGLDPAVKEEVLRREREWNITLQKSAEQRNFHEEFQRVVAPFAPMIAANGHSPLQSVQGLMQTAAALQMGPPAQKAFVVANIMRQFGIDVNLLADALESGGVPQGPQAQQGYDPRVDQLIAERQREQYYAQQRAQAEEARAAHELQTHYAQFGETHEFFEELRGAMASLVQAKYETERVDLSDEEAYTMALSLRPDLQAIVRDRETFREATNPRGSTARSAAAAVSLKPGSVTTRKAAANPDDLHAILEESIDEVMGGNR